MTDAEKKATYQEIKDYVLEHSGLKVSSLYIAQVKQKCGIIERENYNKPRLMFALNRGRGFFLCMSKVQVVQLQCISISLHAALKKSSHLRVIINYSLL